jgi:hypothetical protein
MRRTNFLLLLILQLIILMYGCNAIKQNNMKLSDKNWLRVSGDQIVNQEGDTVYLRAFLRYFSQKLFH